MVHKPPAKAQLDSDQGALFQSVVVPGQVKHAHDAWQARHARIHASCQTHNPASCEQGSLMLSQGL